MASLVENFYLLAHELSIEIGRTQDASNEIDIELEIKPLLVMRDRSRSAQREEGSRKRVKMLSCSQEEFEPQFLVELVG